MRELNLLMAHLRELCAAIASQLRLADERLLLIALDRLTVWKLAEGRCTIKIVVLKLESP
jgi:hypothetical protein